MNLRTALLPLLATAILCATACSRNLSQGKRGQQLLYGGMDIEHTDPVAALDHYEEGIDATASEDSATLRNLHFRLGMIFLRHGLAEECIESMRQAFAIDSARQDNSGMLYCLRSMALAHESRGRIEMAKGTLRKVVTEMPATYSTIYNHIYDDYYSRYEDMLKMTEQESEEHKSALTHLTPNSFELWTAAMAWKAENEDDKERAIEVYGMLANSLSPYVQAYALIQQTALLLQQGHVAKARQCLKAYERALNRINREQDLTKTLLQHHTHYQEIRARYKILYLKHLNRRQLFGLLSVSAISLLAISVLLLSIRTHRQRQAILRFRIEKLRQYQAESQQMAREQKAAAKVAIQDTPIFHRLKQQLSSGEGGEPQKEDWTQLEQAILQFHPQFRNRLRDLVEFSAHDYHVCLLLKAGMKPSEIATLTCRSNEAISSTRRRLYNRATGQKGSPRDWDNVVFSL